MNMLQSAHMKIILIFSLLFLTSLRSFSQVDPRIEWKMMRFANFDLIYDAKHQELANLYAHRIQDNLITLKKYFVKIPSKTLIVLNDRTDLTNGYATPLPYQHIMLFPVLPSPMDSISDYGDWARELTLHEYTHILSFEPKRGFMDVLHAAMGSIITPNILLPRWWLEGVAVDMETRESAHGRLRSSWLDGSLRAYSFAGSLKNINVAEINETSLHTWPQGARPYLFGSLMWSQMIARAGTQSIKNLHWSYAGRVPYFINAPAEEFIGADYPTLFNDILNDIDQRAQKQIKNLGQTSFTQSAEIGFKEAESFSPVISPDGKKMILMTKDETVKRAIKILQRPQLQMSFDDSQVQSGITQKLDEELGDLNPRPQLQGQEDDFDGPPGGTINRFSWLPDSQKFVYDKLDEVNRFHDISDLYIYDLKTKKSEQLTFSQRAREPQVSADGQKVVFIQLDAGRTHLAILDLNTKQVKIIYSPRLQVRLSFPNFLNDHEILLSERDNGNDRLIKFSLDDGKIAVIFPELKEAKFSYLSANKIFFTASQNGVPNVYVTQMDLKSYRPISHTPSVISTSAYDPNKEDLYVTELSSEGNKIKRIEKAQWSALPEKLPQIEPLLHERYQAKAYQPSETSLAPVEDYNALPHLWPRYWIPLIASDSQGTYFSVATSGMDPLQHHAYSLQAAYDGALHETSYLAKYLNSQHPARLAATAYDYRAYLGLTNLRYRYEYYDLGANWQLTEISKYLDAQVSWTWMNRTFDNSRFMHMGPTAALFYSDFSMSGAQISPESGQAAQLQIHDFIDSHDQTAFQKYIFSGQKYFTLSFLPKRHAFFLRAQGQEVSRDIPLADYETTYSFPLFANAPVPLYIVRGYPSFLAKTVKNYSAEFRFPIYYSDYGYKTYPFFIKRFHGAFITDGIQLEGYRYRNRAYESVDRNKLFYSTGLELKADITLGYQFPMTVYFGYYQPQDLDTTDANYYSFGLQF